MEYLKVKSNQQNVIIKKNGEMNFEYKFEEDVIEMPKDHAEYIVSQNSMFEIVSKKPYKKEVKIQKKVKKEETSNSSEYLEELESINGIGPKTAKDIMMVFRIKESLIKAINSGQPLPFDDDVAELLKQKYGGN